MKSFYKTIFSIVILVSIFGYVYTKNTPELKPNADMPFYSDSTGGTAAPLASFKSDADKMFKQLGITKKQWLDGLPTKKALGVPVYPDAVIVGYSLGYEESGKKVLSEITLVSPTDLDKVEKWYSEKLNTWNHLSSYHVFLPPHKNVDLMSDEFDATPHVELDEVTSKDQFTGNFLKQPDNAKTAITIKY